MTSTNKDTRKWLQALNLFDKDVFDELTNMNVKFPESDFKGFTQENWDELYRKTYVARQKYNSSDSQGLRRLQDKLSKIEKEWRRISGVKKRVGGTKKKTGTKNKSSKSKEKSDDLLSKASALKQWMRKQNLFVPEIFEALAEEGVTSPDNLGTIINTNNKFDKIKKNATVKRNKNTQDQKSRNKLRDQIVKFRKVWQEKYDIKNEMKTKNTNKKNNKNNKKEPEGREIRQWLKKNDIFVQELFDELVKRGICTPNDIPKIDTEEKFDDLVKKVRVERRSNEKSISVKNRLDKSLVKFEQFWRKMADKPKQIGTGKQNNKN